MAAMGFALGMFALLSIRALMLPDGAFVLLSSRRLMMMVVGAGIYWVSASWVEAAPDDVRPNMLLPLLLVLFAGALGAFTMRLAAGDILGGVQPDLPENARWTLIWLGYFAAALIGHWALTLRRALRSGHGSPPRSILPERADLEEDLTVWVHSGGKTICLSLAAVEWVEAEGNYVRVHTPTGSGLARQSLAKMHSLLGPVNFIRVHRSAICRRSRIMATQRKSGALTVILQSGTEVAVGRKFAASVKAGLASGIFNRDHNPSSL